MMIAVVITLEPRKDHRVLTPVELGTSLAAEPGHKINSAYRTNGSIIMPCPKDSERVRHFKCCVLEIWPVYQTFRQLKIHPVERCLK